MEIETSLVDLAGMHPELEWPEIAAATVAELEDIGLEPPFRFPIEMQDVPGFEGRELCLLIARTDIPAARVARIRRTFEPSRRTELPAIALAALALYHGGGHEIVDLAIRGSGADYLVDSPRQLLEIAGRSRRSDVEAAWQERLHRLRKRAPDGFSLCVLELETPAGRLAFVS